MSMGEDIWIFTLVIMGVQRLSNEGVTALRKMNNQHFCYCLLAEELLNQTAVSSLHLLNLK